MKHLGFDIILLGNPASGKDTQAKILRQKFSLKPIESGKYWRRMALGNTKISRQLRTNFAIGLMAPVNLMKQFLIKNLNHTRPKQDLIFVGNPRLKPEAELVVSMLKNKKRDFFVVYLKLPNKEVRARSLLRNRDAQDLFYIENRINVFEKDVLKTIRYFKQLRKLKTVDGNQPIKKVTRDILQAINDYKKRVRT